MRKIFSILLALALVLSVGLVTGIPVQASVSQPQVTVNPVRTGEVAEYTIVFDINSSLISPGASITVEFPYDTTVPGTGNYLDGDITINGANATGGDVIVVDREVTMLTPIDIGAPDTVIVVFTTGANITNPTTTGDYTLWVNTSGAYDQTPMESAKYAIRELPRVTTVRPGSGNIGDTMWVVVEGTSFMGDAGTNNSSTNISFGSGADVLQTKYISVNETNVQIDVVSEGTFTVRAQTPAGNSTSNGSFIANLADTEQVDVWEKYTPTDAIFNTDTLVFDSTVGSITTAIAAALPDYTLVAHSGLYEEDLLIDKSELTLTSVSGKDATTIKGTTVGVPGVPNINVHGDAVKIHGFTIETADGAGSWVDGLILNGVDIEIYDNHFKVVSSVATGNAGAAIQTWRSENVDLQNTQFGFNPPRVSDVSGLNIHDNEFSGVGVERYMPIWINRDLGVGLATISGNIMNGPIHRGIGSERSNTLIENNLIESSYAGPSGIIFHDYGTAPNWDNPRLQEDIQLIGNTVSGFDTGIVIGGDGQSLDDVSVRQNTVQDNETGILVLSSAGGVVVHYNNIADNTELGLNNTDSAKLNTLYNWWGDEIGPNHDTRNPGGQLNAVTGNVSFSPWLYKPLEQFAHDAPCLAGSVVLANEATAVGNSSYAGGWNSFSTPVTLDSSANNVSELLNLAAESDLYIIRAQRFNSDTQQWDIIIFNNSAYPPGATYQIKPGEGFYMQVKSKGSLPILVATGITSPTMRNLVDGWNLIGLSSLKEQTVADALSGVDYSMVLSPKPPNDEAWSVPPSGANATDLQLGKAYWLAMAAPGILFGSTYTPVAYDMTWDLNQ
jgi:hypothetical protein